MSQDSNSPRSSELVPSQGIEWSFVWLAVGVLGMVLLLHYRGLGRNTEEKTPAYDRDNQIIPRQTRHANDQPEIGVLQDTQTT
ncbi:MAG: hypothetical protein FJ302_07710 [Planctomycetes bacterium]|nr:hypothetical protein [Planctomycetota bacterium]